MHGSLSDVLEVIKYWGFWVWFIVMVTGQALLLLVPVDLARQRLPSRRKLLWPLIIASLLLGNMAFTGFFSILSAFLGDNASIVVEAPTELGMQILNSIPATKAATNSLGLGGGSDLPMVLTALGMLMLFWLVWALIFFHYAQADAPDNLMRRATHWLLRASILELLVAVPSHIVVRQRGDCCAPFVTFWGIVTGISVMLLSFGPGVFFLFVRRIRQLQPKAPPVPLAPR